MQVHYNGSLVDSNDLTLSPFNRAFQYGDGLFEIMVTSHKEIRFESDHFARLKKGCEVLGLVMPERNWQRDILDVASSIDAPWIRIRFQIWRKEGGIVAPESNEIEWMISAKVFSPAPTIKTNMTVFNTCQLFPTPYSSFKSLQFLPYVLAAQYRRSEGADEIVLFGPDKCVAEAGTGNIFWIKNNMVYTPSVECGCIEGIMRTQLLRFFREQGIHWQEGQFTLFDLLNAESVFTTNVSGISCIQRMANKEFSTVNTLLTQLQARFNLTT